MSELLLQRGINVSYESIRSWAAKFGPAYAYTIKHRSPRRGEKWHLAVYGQVRNLFFLGRYKTAANDYRLKLTEAFQQWNAITLQAYCA